MFPGDCAASAGTLTVCFTANVAGSYSTISPDARSTHSRFACAREYAVSNNIPQSTSKFRIYAIVILSEVGSSRRRNSCAVEEPALSEADPYLRLVLIASPPTATQ